MSFYFIKSIVMKIYLRTFTGDAATYACNVEPSTTIQQLKQILLEKSEGQIDPTTTCLVFDGQQLDDNSKRLSDCSVQSGSWLEVKDLRFTGGRNPWAMGATFVDVSNETSLKVVEWSKTGQKWRRVGPGLCLEGICCNYKEECPAKGKRVIMSLGYIKFDLVGGTDSSITKCPMCSKYVEPLTCAFNNCWWSWRGKKQVKEYEEPTFCSGDWKYAGDAYHYFDENTSGMVQWRTLILEAAKHKP